MILRSRPTPCVMGGCLYVISSRHFTLIQTLLQRINILRPKNFPTWTRFNQFFSPLSRGTSISLNLNSSGLLLTLETFNKEDIFILFLFGQKSFCIQSSDTKKPMFMPTIFLSFFFFHLLTYTNPNFLMGARQWALTLF